MNMNFIENINDNDTLNQIINAAQKRKEVLNDQEREKDWKNFTNALYTYLDKWGDIDITNDISEETVAFLTKDGMNADNPGTIFC